MASCRTQENKKKARRSTIYIYKWYNTCMLLKVRPVSVTTEGRVQFSGISVGEPPVQLLKHISFHIGS